MSEVFIVAENIVSPLGITAAENFAQLKKAVSGIQLHTSESLSSEPVHAALFSDAQKFPVKENKSTKYTKFEQLLIASVEDALSKAHVDVKNKKTLLIVSSTKGNISLVETAETVNDELKKRIAIHTSAQLVADYFQFTSKPVVISHACVSGLAAIITAMRLMQSGQYDTAVVVGADIITKFILSGFQSFQAVSAEPCKPFDADRNGITLGEGAATVILSVNRPTNGVVIKVCSGATSNDANHISGPSRSGEELYQAINTAMKQADVKPADIDFISAHGTATIYNDEMEAKAINLAGMQDIPVNSLKGYYGHTLGAAGLIETVAAVYSLKENIVLPTIGFKKTGTSKPLNVSNKLQEKKLSTCLKTASGFGGCNAAIVLKKEN